MGGGSRVHTRNLYPINKPLDGQRNDVGSKSNVTDYPCDL